MQESQKAGMKWGIVGSIIGGFSWLVILAMVLKSWPIGVIALAAGCIGLLASWRLIDKRPERSLAILGAAVLWIINSNLIFLNLLYDRIPQEINGMTTGKSQISLIQLNGFLAIFAVIGFILVVKDILNKEK